MHLSLGAGDPRFQNAERPELPLIRLRVDHTGFPRITNINKFGQKFVGKVANPEELLLFSKQKAQSTRGTAGWARDSPRARQCECERKLSADMSMWL